MVLFERNEQVRRSDSFARVTSVLTSAAEERMRVQILHRGELWLANAAAD